MDPMSTITVKENGRSQLSGEGAVTEADIVLMVNDAHENISCDPPKPSLHLPEDARVGEILEELPSLDDFANDADVGESVVSETVNGGQEIFEQDDHSTDHAIISMEIEDSAPTLEYLGGDEEMDFGNVEATEVMEKEEETEEAVTVESPKKDEPDVIGQGPTEKTVTPDNDEATEEIQIDKEEKGGEDKDRQKKEGSEDSKESTGKGSTKGKIPVQTDLNINSRPKRSTPRRSVFELLQGEIRSSGPAKRSSTDTGSESDPEPGPSKRNVSKKSKLTGAERLEVISEAGGSKEERFQGSRKGKGHPVKGKTQRKDDSTVHKESVHLSRKKSSEASHDAGASEEGHGDVFMSDDFDLVETVVGADGQNAHEMENVGGDEDDDDEMTLAKFRAENRKHCFDDEPSDNHNVPCEDTTVEIGADAQNNSEQLEYNSRWHSYATPRRFDDPSGVKDSQINQATEVGGDAMHSASDDIRKAAAKSSRGDEVSESKHQETSDLETVGVKSKEPSGSPWYMVNNTKEDEGFPSDSRSLQNRIDELIKANAELKARLKEVESKTATKKFNIDFHSRKFSKAREPVLGSPADRKLISERKSLGKVGVGTPAEKGNTVGSTDKDLKQRELALERREEKLRTLDVELDDRTAQLKVNEGKLWRTERRLKEMEKTLEYRERALRRMEMSIDKQDAEVKEATDERGKDETPIDAASTSGAEVVDAAKLERKEQELERLRRFLGEEREKLLPKQQRLTKWEAELRKKEDELRLREQALRAVSASKEGRSEEDDSESDEDDKPLRTPVTKSLAASHKRHLSQQRSRKVPPPKVLKMKSQGSTPDAIRMKAATPGRTDTPSSVFTSKKRSADSKPVKEYKLRKRC